MLPGMVTDYTMGQLRFFTEQSQFIGDKQAF